MRQVLLSAEKVHLLKIRSFHYDLLTGNSNNCSSHVQTVQINSADRLDISVGSISAGRCRVVLGDRMPVQAR